MTAPALLPRGTYRAVTTSIAELVTDTWREAEVQVTRRSWPRLPAAAVDASNEAGSAAERRRFVPTDRR